MVSKFRKSVFGAILLNLFIPGLGHVYWKEYIFGIFIFLIMLLASILFFVSIFISMPFWGRVVLFALPFLFYLFTFFDLARIIKLKRKFLSFTKKSVITFFLVGLFFQILVPIAPLNFAIKNFPHLFIMPDNSMPPIYNKGDILQTSRLSYLLNIFFVKKPVLYSLPKRYDIVSFNDSSQRRQIGIVIGLPGEKIELIDGLLMVNGLPDYNLVSSNYNLRGNCPLTEVGEYSIIVATLKLGVINNVYQVSLANLNGQVKKVF
ncbi:MAG: hypothetical protein GXO93_06720 [FCB group bacterium]|nr:hypothetical protein [FCB group bacterium]